MLCFFFFRVFCVSFSFFFFVLLLPLILLLTLLLLNDQIENFLGAFTLFQGKELCFFLCGKKVFYSPLFCCIIHELRLKGRGRIKNFLPHKTKQSSLPLNKARNGKKSAFFCQFSSSASISSVSFVYFFLLFFVLLLPLILLLLLLLLNDQIANFWGAFTLFQGKELCFFLCGKKFLIRPYSAASYMR